MSSSYVTTHSWLGAKRFPPRKALEIATLFMAAGSNPLIATFVNDGGAEQSKSSGINSSLRGLSGVTSRSVFKNTD